MLEGYDEDFKQTFSRKTYHYCSLQAGTLIQFNLFKVHTVDKCGRKSDYEVKNISVTEINSQGNVYTSEL